MRSILITYSNEKYKRAQKLCTFTGKYIGKFDEIMSFGPKDIDTTFHQKNISILQEERGNGLWLWKPYFINKVLNTCEDGDLVFYCDSGAFFIRNPEELYKLLSPNNSILVFDLPLLESCFTKTSCLQAMGCDTEYYKNSSQIMATYFILRVCDQSRKFINEWLEWCENKDILCPLKGSHLILKTEFVAHREDQSIFSLLCKKHQIVPHRDCSQRGLIPESYYDERYAFCRPRHDDKYRSVLYLHKSANVNGIDMVKQILRYTRLKRKYQHVNANYESSKQS